jgi:hypothetical protein
MDGGERGRDDWIQTRVSGNREQWDEFRTDKEDMTANKDCIPASDVSRPPTSVDLPRSKTTPKPPSVAPPLGEHVMVNAVMTVNGTHSPPEQSSAGARKRVAGTPVNEAQPPLEHSSAGARKRVRWRQPVQCSTHDTATTRGRSATLNGIQPPILLSTGHLATGTKTDRLRLQNKRRRHAFQDAQVPTSFEPKSYPYRTHGLTPTVTKCARGTCARQMVQNGLPNSNGKPLDQGKEMWEAVERGPHKSSLTPAAIAHFAEESAEKVRVG